MSLNKIFVLGSNSFSASNFINHKLSKDTKIIGVSRSKEYKNFLLPYKKNKNIKNFKFYKYNINNHLKKIIDLIDDFKPNIIVNFAAQGDVRTSWLYPDQWYETNFLSHSKFTNQLIGKKFLKKYLNISTPEIYGSNINNLIENSCFDPSTPYALSKLSGDLHLNLLKKKYNFPVLFSMSANVYGPSQQLYRIIPRTIIFLMMGKKIRLHGRGKSSRSFIHIKDVVNAYSSILSKGKIGERYHISSSEGNVTIYNLVKKICKILNYNFKESVILEDENFGQDKTYKLNSSKLINNTNWKDKISIEKGIIDTKNWIESHWNTIINEELNYIHKK